MELERQLQSDSDFFGTPPARRPVYTRSLGISGQKWLISIHSQCAPGEISYPSGASCNGLRFSYFESPVNDEEGAIPVFQIDPIAQHFPVSNIFFFTLISISIL